MPNLILPHCDDLPPFDSDFFNTLAAHLWDRFIYCRDARRGLETKWLQCDEAYFAKRYLPKIGTMDWVLDGDMGETDLHDIVNLLSIRLSQAAMPRNRQWLKCTSRKWEAQEVITAVQDQQLYLHELAQTRRNMARFIKQQIIRGFSTVYVSWVNRYRLRRAGRAESRRRAADMFENAGMSRKDASKVTRGRVREIAWAGPRVEVLDDYDVFIHPIADILNDNRPFTIIQRFRRLSELFAEKDDDDQDVYSNLGTPDKPEIVPFEAAEIWNNRDFAYGRAATQMVLGMNPTRMPSGEKVVPVYVFFIPYLEWKGEEFWDCYFYLARSKTGAGVRIIRYEENDSDMGWNRLIMDNYIDWITPGNLGISPVFMSLSKWDQLNLIEALTVQAAMANIFPAMMVNDEGFVFPNELEFGPGGVNPITGNMDPKLIIQPVPASANGLNLGEQAGRLWSEKLRGQMNVDGMQATNSANTASSRRTATEINQNTTSGSVFLDNQADQISTTLTRVAQIVHDDSRQNLRPDPWGNIEYDKYVQDEVRRQTLPLEALDVDRSISVTGFMGVMNEQQEIGNLLQALEVSQPILPVAPQIAAPFVAAAYEMLMARLHIDPKNAPPAPGMGMGMPPPPMGGQPGGMPPGPMGQPGAAMPPPPMGQQPPPQMMLQRPMPGGVPGAGPPQ